MTIRMVRLVCWLGTAVLMIHLPPHDPPAIQQVTGALPPPLRRPCRSSGFCCGARSRRGRRSAARCAPAAPALLAQRPVRGEVPVAANEEARPN